MKLAYSFVAQPKQRTGIAEPDSLVVDEDAYRLMACDACALERNLAEGEPRWCDPATRKGRSSPVECSPVGLVDGATVGCFPDLYTALSTNTPDQVISL